MRAYTGFPFGQDLGDANVERIERGQGLVDALAHVDDVRDVYFAAPMSPLKSFRVVVGRDSRHGCERCRCGPVWRQHAG